MFSFLNQKILNYVAWLGAGLPCMHIPRDSVPDLHGPGMTVHTCRPSIGEVEAGGSGIHSHVSKVRVS